MTSCRVESIRTRISRDIARRTRKSDSLEKRERERGPKPVISDDGRKSSITVEIAVHARQLTRIGPDPSYEEGERTVPQMRVYHYATVALKCAAFAHVQKQRSRFNVETNELAFDPRVMVSLFVLYRKQRPDLISPRGRAFIYIARARARIPRIHSESLLRFIRQL